MADPEHLKILEQGVAAWNQWRAEKPGVLPALGGADLRGAFLSRADFRVTGLAGANVTGANLSRANLIAADLRGADLRGANLSRAYLAEADLHGADFSGAKLDGANLAKANLQNSDFTNASVGFTVFGDNDLSTVKGLETVQHSGPSTIGVDTIYKSRGDIPEAFLRGAGVPEDFITYMPSLVGKAIDFYSCFISYSSQDDDFAQRLYADLQAKNVRCWKFDENAKWGEPLWGEIDTAISWW